LVVYMYMHTHKHIPVGVGLPAILGNWLAASPFPVECVLLLECVLLGILGNWLVASPFPMELNVQAKKKQKKTQKSKVLVKYLLNNKNNSVVFYSMIKCLYTDFCKAQESES
jgi:hypothetical protein